MFRFISFPLFTVRRFSQLTNERLKINTKFSNNFTTNSKWRNESLNIYRLDTQTMKKTTRTNNLYFFGGICQIVLVFPMIRTTMKSIRNEKFHFGSENKLLSWAKNNSFLLGTIVEIFAYSLSLAATGLLLTIPYRNTSKIHLMKDGSKIAITTFAPKLSAWFHRLIPLRTHGKYEITFDQLNNSRTIILPLNHFSMDASRNSKQLMSVFHLKDFRNFFLLDMNVKHFQNLSIFDNIICRKRTL
ncbi:hypothetical protein SNEBB_008348 [Seison nebaliae]|nr:hypothetical protein SNEBB_008348 [Seison nebaliae]